MPNYIAAGDISSLRTPTKEAEARALKLLLSHLTPAQLDEFNKSSYFTVIGSDTKSVFRIFNFRSGNIKKMRGEATVGSYCVVTGYDIPVHDQLLAQKIGIETREMETMKIAIGWEEDENGQNVNPYNPNYFFTEPVYVVPPGLYVPDGGLVGVAHAQNPYVWTTTVYPVEMNGGGTYDNGVVTTAANICVRQTGD